MDAKRVMKKKPTKHMWKPEEDLVLKKYVETHGEGNWATVSQQSGLMRNGKSCRLRWKNYLRPNIKLGDMSQEEEDLIVRMHKLLGNRWSLIAGRLPGRTDNEVKNYWNTHLSKTRPQGKRKLINNMDRGQDSETKSKKNKTEDSQLVASESQKINEDKMDDGRRKDEENKTTLLIPSMTGDPRSFNYNMESPIMSCHGSMVVFDDEPLATYMDSFLLFEAFGYSDNSTGENLAESSVQSFIP